MTEILRPLTAESGFSTVPTSIPVGWEAEPASLPPPAAAGAPAAMEVPDPMQGEVVEPLLMKQSPRLAQNSHFILFNDSLDNFLSNATWNKTGKLSVHTVERQKKLRVQAMPIEQ